MRFTPRSSPPPVPEAPPQASNFLSVFQSNDERRVAAALGENPELAREPALSALLRQAVNQGLLNSALALLKNGADPDGPPGAFTLLMSAAGRGALDEMELLLPFSAPNRAHAGLAETALMMALSASNLRNSAVSFLAGVSDLNARDAFGQTALIRAVRQGDPSLVNALAANSDLGILDHFGRSALFHAVSLPKAGILSTLLELSPSEAFDAQDVNGDTPLMLAARCLSATRTDALAPFTDQTLKNKRGETAFDLAVAAAQKSLANEKERYDLRFLPFTIDNLALNASDDSLRRVPPGVFDPAQFPVLAARLEALALRDAVSEVAPSAALVADASHPIASSKPSDTALAAHAPQASARRL